MILPSWSRRIAVLIALSFFNIFFIFFHISKSIPFVVLALIFSVLGMYFGSSEFVTQSESMGEIFKLSGKSTGLIIVAIGSIADEIFVSTIAAYRGYGSLSLGNIMGSNIVTMIIFIPLMIILPLSRSRLFIRDASFLAIAIIVVIIFSLFYPSFPRFLSIPLLVVFCFYIYMAFERKVNDDGYEGKPSLIMIIASLLTIFFSSYSMVNYSLLISNTYKLTFFESGFFVTGIGGSLPEIFMGSISLLRRKKEMALGVLFGSSIIKMSLVLGIVTSFGDVIETGVVWTEYIFLAIVAVSMYILWTKGFTSRNQT